MTIEDHWNDIVALALHEGVPRVIRTHFDTARNLLLYSWHVYGFEPVAEMHAYGSVEFALRLRAGFPPRSGLRSLLVRAVKEGWIRDARFRQYSKLIESRAKIEQEEEASSGTPAASARKKTRSYVQLLAEYLPEFRNKLAHGSGMLAPRGRSALALCCDLINQLFPMHDGEAE